jgi:predicted RNase H-like HicB family nuclease
MEERYVANVLIYPGNSVNWIAHCLEFDLLAHGKTPKDAVKRLIGVVTTHIDYLEENDLLDQLYDPAPEKYWKMLRNAKQIGGFELRKLRREGLPAGRFPPIHEMARLNLQYDSRLQANV